MTSRLSALVAALWLAGCVSAPNVNQRAPERLSAVSLSTLHDIPMRCHDSTGERYGYFCKTGL